MWLTFRAYGNYENRGKARTRYMQEILGGPEKYAEAFLEKLNQVLASGENLDLAVAPWDISKKGNGSTACGARVIPPEAGRPLYRSMASSGRPA